jgi:hypothetical protein
VPISKCKNIEDRVCKIKDGNRTYDCHIFFRGSKGSCDKRGKNFNNALTDSEHESKKPSPIIKSPQVKRLIKKKIESDDSSEDDDYEENGNLMLNALS